MSSITLHFFFPGVAVFREYHQKFQNINSQGFITAAGIAFAVVAMALYLAGLYSILQTSFLLRRSVDEKERILQKTVVLELELQKQQADFRTASIPELSDMEKISSIKYISGERATALLPNTLQGR